MLLATAALALLRIPATFLGTHPMFLLYLPLSPSCDTVPMIY